MKLENINKAAYTAKKYLDISKHLNNHTSLEIALEIDDNFYDFSGEESLAILEFIKSMLKDKLIKLGVELPQDTIGYTYKT